uniref:Ig-like domain-containing protein n=1 Tax=Chrysemys picta bellii TaxID=8478 RepID=A0A8C3F7H1_CHRPI
TCPKILKKGVTVAKVKVASIDIGPISGQIMHAVVEEGGHAKYTCKIENYDQSTQVTWYFGIRQLENNGKYEISYQEGVATMYVKDITKSDDGTYRCKVVNDYGEDISEFGVTITVHPEPRVTWFKSGQKIKPGDDDRKYAFESDKGLYQLTIHNLTEDDDAEYSILARNKYGEDSCKAKLTVIPHPPPADTTLRPMFKRLLANAECQEGQSVCFEIRISGVPKPTLKWEKDGQPLSCGPNIEVVYEGLDYYALHIRDTLPEDSGYYRVTATNSAGSSSCQAYLKVERLTYVKHEYKSEEEREKHVQKQIDKTLRMAEILSGTETVPLTQATEAYAVSSFKKTSAIEASSSVREVKSEMTETRESLSSYERYASAEKKITAAEEKSLEERASLKKFKTTLPATILTKPRSITVSEGETARFSCDIDGEPTPTVTWLRAGQAIVSSRRFQVTRTQYKSTFEISSVQTSDEGSYILVVENSEGRQEAPFTLTVQRSPEPVKSPKRVKSPEPPTAHAKAKSAAEGRTTPVEKVQLPTAAPPKITQQLKVEACGDKVRFSCAAESSILSVREVSWYKDGNKLKEDSHFMFHYSADGTYELKIHNLTESDQGEYTCEITGEGGVSKTNFQFVGQPPALSGSWQGAGRDMPCSTYFPKAPTLLLLCFLYGTARTLPLFPPPLARAIS